jgi:hypothetical protein
MKSPLRLEGIWTATLAVLVAAPAWAQAPAGTTEPVAREQADQPAAEVAARVPPMVAQVAPASPFDLEPRAGEHPLMPALRVAQESLKHMDATIQDYQAILYKHERIDGELPDRPEVAYIKVRQQPFSVHLFFLAPNQGRECLYVEGPNGTGGKLHARDSGFKRKLGVFELPPDGRLAMAGQKYPITKIGIRNLITELITVASSDVNYGECEVTTAQTVLGPKDGEKRPVTLITVIHPVPRDNFRFHKAELYIDNELRIPIRYASYLWPANPGEAPPLEEAYTYVNLKVNNGFTDMDFSRQNPDLFKSE